MLNGPKIRALVPPSTGSRNVYDTEVKRLAIKVYWTGTKSWKFIYSVKGPGRSRTRTKHLGDFPSVDVNTARRMANELAGQVAIGKDPQGMHMAVKSTDTFGWLVLKYYGDYADHLRAAHQGHYLIHKYVPETFQNTQVGLILRKDVRAVLAPLEFKTPMLAKQLLSAISTVFRFGIRQEVVAHNPCAGIERIKCEPRTRVLTDSEIPRFWAEFGNYGLVGVALKFLLLTGQRPGEVAWINRQHIEDRQWWHMPREATPVWCGTKNRTDHWIWLPDAALTLLPDGDADGIVFADAKGLRWQTGRYLNRGPLWLEREMQRTMRKISKKLGVPPARPHDLRRTHGTKITSLLGFGGKDAMNRVQNHREGGVHTVYDHYQYAAEKQRVMEMVAANILALIEGRKADNVIDLVAR
jgi:integrase